MDNYFETYNEYKEDILALLNESREFYIGQGLEKQAKSLQDNIDVILSGEFEVVVVGEFSSGKSTFLNALMREKYLPSYTKETTATINYLRNASESEHPGIAYYYNREPEYLPSLDYDVVEQYVSTNNKTMRVEENISHLDLYIDSPFLENKVTLIDSPGLNGMRKGLGEITNAQISRSHAVIFMFSAEQSGKRSEFEILKRIKDQVDTVFLVLNKIDCIKESENETIEDKIQDLIDSYKQVFPADTTLPEIIPVAAYPALVARSKLNLDYPQNHFDLTREEKDLLEEKSLMSQFEAKLLHFLTNSEKTVTQIKEPVQRLQGLLAESIVKYENEIETVESQSDGAKLQEQISLLNNALTELEKQLGEQSEEITQITRRVERETLEMLDSELENARRQLRVNVDELDDLEALGDYNDLLNNLLERKMDGVAYKLDQNFRDNFFVAVQNQYMGIISVLEQKIDTTEMEGISFDTNINVSAKSISAGIENFTAMKEDLRKQMEELEVKKSDMATKEAELILIEDKREKLQHKLDQIERSQSELKESFCPPEVIILHKVGKEEVNRPGLFGGLVDMVKGKRTESVSYEDIDDRERKEYISDYKEQMKQLIVKQNELETRLDEMLGTDKKLEIVSAERTETQAKLEELRAEEKQLTKQFNHDLNEKYNKEIERVKKKAYSDIDVDLDRIRTAIARRLRDNRKIYSGILQNLIEQSVRSQIEQKREECDNLLKLKEEANDNKKAILDEKCQQKEKAISLKNKADEIIGKINSIEIDRVKYQNI